jgi:glycine oxidase
MKKIVIIGAGVAGLGIGWKLAEAGAEVTILERAQAGGATTLASGGMVAAAAELGHTSGPDVEFAHRSGVMWPGFAAALQERTGIEIGYRRNGSLLVMLEGEVPHAKPELGETCPHAHSSAHGHAQAHGKTEPDEANPHAHGTSKLSPAEARAMEPMLAETVKGALWAPDEAVVDTHAMARALIAAFQKAGGTLSANEAAVNIETEDGRVSGVRTPFALYHADAYILAAGAWNAHVNLTKNVSGRRGSHIEELPGETLPPVIPVKGEIMVLEPPAGAALPKHTVWGNGIYVVPRGNRLLVGATAELAGYDTSPTPEATAWLRRQSAGLMPALQSWRMVEHWVGLRPASPDGMPILGQSAVEGLFIAGGQYRNGILFAPAIAETMSRLVLERATVDVAFDPRRFSGAKADKPGFIIETAHRQAGPGIHEWHAGL